MNRNLKSVMYAFVANDIEVYVPDSEIANNFIASKLLCSKCHNYWHTSLLECYFCGELNYYLYTCTSCGKKYSITNSSIKCECKNLNSKLIKACVNPNCPSNSEKDIHELAKKQGGIFDLNSSFKLSLNYCVKCGNISNYYETFKIFIYDSKENEKLSIFIDKNGIEKNDIIIYKNKSDSTITYDYLKLVDTAQSYTPNYRYDRMENLIEDIFGGKNHG